ncbi:general stress protein [Microbacterium rhizomatis]|uniref:general stress protein n=1 Tax=Microbacterium rhizomatis TaxID=1631477 RepID=UPI001FE5AEDE|nr:general stress protein [Microbacterium rhizomatis]
MSMMGPRIPQGRGAVGETIATYPTYEAAQKAVSALIAGEVPAREIAIVGQGLRSVERVTGRLGYAAAARSGAINGVLLGLFFSAIVVLGTPSVPIQVFVGVLFVGIAIGMLLSIVSYSFVRRRRDFASVMQVTADSYDIAVSASAIHRARQILGAQNAPVPARPSAPRPPAGGTAPTPPADVRAEHEPERPRYGERVPQDPAERAPQDPAERAPEPPEQAVPAPDEGAAEPAADQSDHTTPSR